MNGWLKRFFSVFAVMLMAFPVIAAAQTVGEGFTVAWELDPNVDPAFADRGPGFGARSVMSGMDFDGDGLREILFTTDETLAPAGPDPGLLDVFLFEADGNNSYQYVWHFTTPDPSNSLPGLAYGDIDEDGLTEIYFGVAPAAGSNDDSWGTYIFEQGEDGVFPAEPTLVYTYDLLFSDNFRPSGIQLADVDNDGDIELLTVDRGTRKFKINSLTSESFDAFASFGEEYALGDTTLGGGSVYDLMVVDFDGDDLNEIWINTWDNWSMAVVEVVDTNEYALQLDLNSVDSNNDPGSFNSSDLFFKDVDGDGALEGWFPMSNGVLYFLDNVDSSVTEITADDIVAVGSFGGRSRGASIGDIDGDGRTDIIAGTGTEETVSRIEYLGFGDPADSTNYEWSTIYSLEGAPADRFYSLSVSPVDLDGDGHKEVVLTNLKASEVGQSMIIVLEYNPFDAPTLAASWNNSSQVNLTDGDDLFQADFSGNSRTGIAGMDMDQDGAYEVILTDYAGARVVVFEYDDVNDVFEAVWTSPRVDTVSHHANNPRTVSVGDLDGDGKEEIVYPVAATGLEGWWVFEWDGVNGSDNYGTTYSSINAVEIDTCCAGDGGTFRADHERSTVVDVDGDGQQELVSMIRRGSARGTLITSVIGDIEHNAGGAGFETWVSEFFVDRGGYGGGSPYHSQPADLDGDGSYELVNTTWNYMNFYNVDATGTDTYVVADPASETRYYQATYPSDHVALFGGSAGDVDGNGDDEAFFANYYTGDLYVVDYQSGDDVLSIDETHVVKAVEDMGGNYAGFGTSVFDVDGNGKANVFLGSSYPRTITSAELVGTDPRNPADYETKVIYTGEHDVLSNIEVTTDADGNVFTEYGHTGVFASKVQSHFNGTGLDFDNDGDLELFASFQSNVDSITTTNYTWNATNSAYDTVETKVVNDKAWAAMLFEFGEGSVSVGEMTFVTPDDYQLMPNYPNPFNPVTNIDFVLPMDKQISLKIYNILGQHVRTLVNNELREAGNHHVKWDGTNMIGAPVASGVYIYSLEWGNFKKTQTMTLLK